MSQSDRRALAFGFVGGLVAAVSVEWLVRAVNPSAQDLAIVVAGVAILAGLTVAAALVLRES